MADFRFASLMRGAEEISKQADEAFRYWADGDVESCLDALEGAASDAEKIAKRARQVMAELAASVDV